ncbi:hypothetical protein [Maritalea myrionectae]|uniref:Uncharacterized protein n=1 Tax=Maritalea myrionectae TaxID=454601 RepID=A0A2R4MCS4_9HYPH|nr:hypothetical protein [Maritalea myrionectae]AVX03827.1 hypothetical protein MXMO3_01296 [Maritalea myrionectae]
MRYIILALLVGLGFTSPAAAQTFSSGDWAASKIGQVCYVFTTRSARDTSGALVFRFENQGYNAGFSYEYAPWPGETGAPWGENDYVALEVDGEVTWLSDEMLADLGPTGYNASMTSGFVSEMITELNGASDSIGFAMERQSDGETVLYGLFSPAGFTESMARAGEMCQFSPSALPAS